MMSKHELNVKRTMGKRFNIILKTIQKHTACTVHGNINLRTNEKKKVELQIYWK